jgi:beta-lactamase regulating signal transducer with metallopeptidase domain
VISTFGQILESAFLKTAEISLQASFIIAVLLIIRPAIKRVLPPNWVYALWFVVVVRLLLVDVPTLPAPVGPRLQNALAAVQNVNGQLASMPHSAFPSASPLSTGDLSPTWPEMLAGIWAIGAAFFLFRLGFESVRWSLQLAKAPEIDGPEVRQLLEECRREMGVRNVRLVQLAGFASPSMTGLFRPVIILPEDFLARFTPEELRWIFLHEMAHLKRWDLPMQLLCQMLQAIHWFNPLVWFAFFCFRGDRELACDAHVLDRQAREASRDYGHALIKVAETYPRSLFSAGFLGVSEAKTDLHERVEKISQHRRPALAWVISGIILCALLAVVFLTRAATQAPHEAIAKMQIFKDVAYVPAEVEVIQSENVVVPAIVGLGLDKVWAKRLGSNESTLTPAEIMDRVGGMLTVKQTSPLTDIVYITVRDNDAREGADIANAIVKQYTAGLEAAQVADVNQRAHDVFDKRIAKMETDLAQTKAGLEKLEQDTTHPPNNDQIQTLQNSISNEQLLLDGTRSQMEDQIAQGAKGSQNAVRLLAPAY